MRTRRTAPALVLALAMATGSLVGSPTAGAESDGQWDYTLLSINGTYEPVSGDFAGDFATDVYWYAPGTGTDRLWIATGDEDVFDTSRTETLNGTYAPEVLRDWRSGKKDRIFWYRPGD